MQVTDEVLMAYADGELDPQTRAAVEAAMQSDPQIAVRIAEHRALREQLSAAFAGVLDEPVPERLEKAANEPPRQAHVADLAMARAARYAPSGGRRWAWKEWTAIAASVVMGVLVGRTTLQSPNSEFVTTRGEQLIAAGALDRALSTQVGATAGEGRVSIAATFRAKSGEYCRTFSADGEDAVAGVACRAENAWRIHLLTQPTAQPSAGYRMAGSALPAIVSQTAESMMSGEALDAEQEAAAREQGWRTSP